MATQYTMRALNTTLNRHVYWFSIGSADTAAKYSGYDPAQLTNIVVDYTSTVPDAIGVGNLNLLAGDPGPAGPGFYQGTVSGGSITTGNAILLLNNQIVPFSLSLLASAGGLGGVAISTTGPGSIGNARTQGPDVLIGSLGDGYACAVGCKSDGTLCRVTDASCVTGLNYVGYCDINGKITVAPKHTDVLIATDFGLIGDGVTLNDGMNTLMINSVACQSGVDIFYPGGNYAFAQTIGPFPLGARVSGAGISGRATGLSTSIGTTFLITGRGVGLQAGGHASEANVGNGAIFQDFEILGQNPNQTGADGSNINEVGIEIQNDIRVTLRNIRFGGFKYQLSFDGCECCVADGMNFDGIPPGAGGLLGYSATAMVTDNGATSSFAARFGAFNSPLGASACNQNTLTNVQLNDTYWGFFHQGGIGNKVSNVNSEIKGLAIFGGTGESAATFNTTYENIIGEGTLTCFRFLESTYTPAFYNVRLGQDAIFLDIQAPMVNLGMYNVYLINSTVAFPVMGSGHIVGGACIGCAPPDGDGYSTIGVIFDVDPGMLVDTGNGMLGIYGQPLSPLDVNGNSLRIRTSKTPSSSSDSSGNIGDICWDANYLYTKTGVGDWKKTSLTQVFGSNAPLSQLIAGETITANQAVSLNSSGQIITALSNYNFTGIALTSGISSNIIQTQVIGPLNPSIFNLGDGYTCAVGVNSSGLPVRITDSTCVSGLNYLGYCDGYGTITIAPQHKTYFVPSDFGAIGDDITDDTASLQFCMNAAAANQGFNIEQPAGTMYLEPYKKYYCASQLILNTVTNLIVKGPSQIRCGISDAATDFFLLKSCTRITFEDVIVTYSSATFTGNLFKITNTGIRSSDSQSLAWHRCYMYGSDLTAGHHQANAGIAFAGCVDISITECDFIGMIQGIDSDYNSYANRVLIASCNFYSLTNGGVHNPGEAWTILNCTFEPLEISLYAQNGIFMDLTGQAYGLSIHGCWFGDGHPNSDGYSNWIYVVSDGLDITGNFFATASPGYCVRCDSCIGINVTGNYFAGDPIRFNVAMGGPSCSGLFMASNSILNATTPVDFTHVSTFTCLASTDPTNLHNILSTPIRFGSDDSNSLLTGFYQHTFSWTPGAILAGQFATTTVAVTEAQAGDAIAIGCDIDLGAGVILSGNMYINGACRITIFNATSDTVTLGALTLRVVAID